MRLALGGDQYAELRERLTYEQARAVRLVYLATAENHERAVDVDLALVKAYVSSWLVLDDGGDSISLETPEFAPDDVIQAIALKASGLWQAKASPKGGQRTSRSTPRALRSA